MISNGVAGEAAAVVPGVGDGVVAAGDAESLDADSVRRSSAGDEQATTMALRSEAVTIAAYAE
ncbi:MAG: hypothetical protein ACRDGK_00905 [Actinomycetota bacterium]